MKPIKTNEDVKRVGDKIQQAARKQQSLENTKGNDPKTSSDKTAGS